MGLFVGTLALPFRLIGLLFGVTSWLIRLISVLIIWAVVALLVIWWVS